MVLLRDTDGSIRAGKIELHIDVGGHALSLLYPWKLVRKVRGTHMYIWEIGDAAEYWKTCDILIAVIYTMFPDGSAGILMPRGFRF